jgi:gliding motility-associated-like protein
MLRILIFLALLNFGFRAFTQVTAADCINAVNICQNATFAIDPNGPGSVADFQSGTVSNPSANPASGNSGCLLGGELNPTWMIINIAGSGSLQFSLGQDMGIGCFDWIMWPYSSNACSQIQSNQLAPIRCNWNGACEGFTGIASPLPAGGDPSNFEPPLNVTAGQQYLLCLSNYSSQTTNVPLNFFGTANVSCNTVLPVTINNATICPGQSATLTATVTGATSYLWSPGGQTTASITVSPGSTTTYTCTVGGTTANGGVSSGSGTATVTILPANSPQCGCTVTASNNGPVCVGSTFNLTASNVTGGTYVWDLAGNPIGNTQNVTNLPASASGSYPITVTATDNAGHVCTGTTTVVINPLPNVSAGVDQTICFGNSVTLSGSGATTYQWSGGIQNGVVFTPNSNSIYTVTGTDVNGCVNSDDVSVNLLYAQIPSITPSITLGCVPSTIIFNNNNSTSQNCQWTFGNGTTSTGCGSQTATYGQVGCYDVTLTQTDSQGCDTTVTFNDIICIEESEASFYVSPGIIGASNSTVNFFNTSSGAVSYQWLFGDGESSSAIDPTHTYSTSLQTGYIATLITTSQAGCTDTTSSPIQYEEQLIFYVPNSFTPDADEHNQLFTPVFTSGFAPNNFEMTIYNRWGELIFESRDHTKGWDGSYGVRGGVVQAGLYSWIIRYKPKDTDEKLVVNGFVNVLR